MEAFGGFVEDEADALAVVAIETGVVQVITELRCVAEIIFQAAGGVLREFGGDLFCRVAKEQ